MNYNLRDILPEYSFIDNQGAPITNYIIGPTSYILYTTSSKIILIPGYFPNNKVTGGFGSPIVIINNEVILHPLTFSEMYDLVHVNHQRYFRKLKIERLIK